MNGLLLAFQFFTTFPIKKELPLGRKEVTMMYMMLPVVGLVIGLLMYGVSILGVTVLGFSYLLTAVLVLVTGFGITGGLHLDGWADTADAFFSYKDPEKRFAILEDPRLGAFGTMALIFLVLIKFALIYEAFHQQIDIAVAFIFIPLVARTLVTICFAMLEAGKSTGIAFFLKERLSTRPVVIVSSSVLLATFILYGVIYGNWLLALVLASVCFFSIYYFRRWALRHFHGITGDLAGAYIEGMEVVLWLSALHLL